MTALLVSTFLALHAAFAWGRARAFRIDGATPSDLQ
jgi:hypothetical protein